MMKKIIIAILAAFPVFNLFGQQFRSPDGRLAVELSCGDGQPAYTLTYDNTPSIVSSSLGLVLDCADFSKNLSIDKDGIRIDTVQVEYSLGKIKKNKVSHKAVEAVVPFTSAGKPAFDLILHISDNDLAFKYRISRIGDHRIAQVREECTSFVFPDPAEMNGAGSACPMIRIP